MAIGFLERSRIERSVLVIVNEHFSYHPLNGLSESAIVCWANSVLNENNTSKVECVKGVLLEISHRIRSNSDASKHVFAGELLVSNGTTEVCIEELKNLLLGN